MKARVAILVMVLGLFLTAPAFANDPTPATSAVSKSVANYLHDNLEYPDFAVKEKIECCVMAEITIQENGSFKVTACNCASQRMKEEVSSSIEKIHKKSDIYAPFAGEKVYMKISFHLID